MIIDIAFIAALIYGVWMGFTRGWFRATNNIIKIIFGGMLAMKFSHMGGTFLDTTFKVNATYLPLFAFLLTFLVIMLLFSIVGRQIGNVTGHGKYNMVSKGLNVLTFIFLLSLFFSTLLWYGEQSSVVGPEIYGTSEVYPYVESIYPVTSCRFSYIFPSMGEVLGSFQNVFGDLAHSVKGECM